VKTLRRKLVRLAVLGHATEFGRQRVERRLQRFGTGCASVTPSRPETGYFSRGVGQEV
jgi:hypothetical protein